MLFRIPKANGLLETFVLWGNTTGVSPLSLNVKAKYLIREN